MISIQKILCLLIAVSIVMNCNRFSETNKNSKEDYRFQWMNLLGLQIGRAEKIPDSDSKFNGFIYSIIDNQPLIGHILRLGSVSHYGDGNGKFVLFLKPGKHRILAYNSIQDSIGWVEFDLNESDEIHNIHYSENSAFQITLIPNSENTSISNQPNPNDSDHPSQSEELQEETLANSNPFPKAKLTLNEIAPGITGGLDYVEIYTLQGGTTQGLNLCNRGDCVSFPERIIETGDYIVFRTEEGIDDDLKTDGLHDEYWEFFGAFDMQTTDSIASIMDGFMIQSALLYSDGDGNWTGGGNVHYAIAQGKWSINGPLFGEVDSIRKNPGSTSRYTSNDTLIKFPNGCMDDDLSTWFVSLNSKERSIGRNNNFINLRIDDPDPSHDPDQYPSEYIYQDPTENLNLYGCSQLSKIAITQWTYGRACESTSNDSEFIEIANLTDKNINMNGWSLYQGDNLIHRFSDSILPNSYYLLGLNKLGEEWNPGTAGGCGITPDSIFSESIKLGSSGNLELRNSNDELVDTSGFADSSGTLGRRVKDRDGCYIGIWKKVFAIDYHPGDIHNSHSGGVYE